MNKKDNEEKEELKRLVSHLRQQIEQLHQIATRDEKTGAYNSMFFKSVFELELNKVKRNGTFSLIVVDLDYFKNVNDTYGHIVADKLLKRTVEVLQKGLRGEDVLARFGGEEFFILLPAIGVGIAKDVAERLRKAILREKFLSKYGVTISAGVSEYKKGDNFDRLANRADKALYKAKELGRNQVFVGK